MSVLQQSDLIKMDIAFDGQPFVNIATTGLKTNGLDYSFKGQPFVTTEIPYIQKVIFIL